MVSVSSAVCTRPLKRGPMIGERAWRAPRSGLIGRDRLAADLRALRLQPGQNLLIHCSLRQLGRIDGGAGALLDAIMDVAGPEATLVVPPILAGKNALVLSLPPQLLIR